MATKEEKIFKRYNGFMLDAINEYKQNPCKELKVKVRCIFYIYHLKTKGVVEQFKDEFEATYKKCVEVNPKCSNLLTDL